MARPMHAEWAPPTLETDRLILRAIRASDAPAIFAYASSPNVARYTLWQAHEDLSDAVSFIREYVVKRYQDQQPEPFGITLRSEPELVVGTVGCFWVSRSNRTMELGYALAEPLWGKGLAAEAARAVLDFVFAEYVVERVQCRCKAENTQSARVMEKLMMTHEGTQRSALFHRGRFWDMRCHALLRSEWRGT